jgi:cell wall-associated NlpC family hydrolase
VIQYDNLVGVPFQHGINDCYSLIRQFYIQNFDIVLPNYARPNGWWREGMDMYMERYHKNGFQVLDIHPSLYQIGDVFLMSIMSPVTNHGGVLVEKGRLLHHFTNRLSTVEPYKGIWRNCTTAVMRHKDVVAPQKTQVVSITDVLPNIKRKLDESHQ